MERSSHETGKVQVSQVQNTSEHGTETRNVVGQMCGMHKSTASPFQQDYGKELASSHSSATDLAGSVLALVSGTSPDRHKLTQCQAKVHGILLSALKKFPNAHGLCIAFSNERGHGSSRYFFNIHNSSAEVSSTLGNLGYATCIFQSFDEMEILSVFFELSKITFEKSIKGIFIYITGHGHKGYISATNGHIHINKLKALLSAGNPPNLRNLVKILFIDCCRTGAYLRDEEPSPSVENLAIFYTCPLGQESLHVNDAGLSIATMELLKLLRQEKPCNLHTLLSIDLSRNLNKAGENSRNLRMAGEDSVLALSSLRIEFEGSLYHNIDLYGDKLKSMAPRNLHIRENPDTDTCTVTWNDPLHVSHYNFIYYSIMSIVGENFTEIKTNIRGNEIELQRSTVGDKKLSVRATYSDLDIDGCKDGECSAVFLESDRIKPEDVVLTIAVSGERKLTWKSPPSLAETNVEVSIQRAQRSDNITDESWDFIETEFSSINSTYDIADEHWSDDSEYRIRIHNGTTICRWIPATRRQEEREPLQIEPVLRELVQGDTEQGETEVITQKPGIITCMKNHKCELISSIVAFIIFLVFTASIYPVEHKELSKLRRSNMVVIVGGKVIDCEQLNANEKIIFSKISITQVELEHHKDNTNGLKMYIQQVKRSHLKFHAFTYFSNDTEYDDIPTSSPFLLPSGYLRDTPYLWKGSSIWMSVKLIYKQMPMVFKAHIIKGYDLMNSFLGSPTANRTFEMSFDLLKDPVINWTVKHNDFYFIAVELQPHSPVSITADVLINGYSLHHEDYNFSNGVCLRVKDEPIQLPLQLKNEKITLCYAKKLNETFDRNRIHLLLQYALRSTMLYSPPFSLLVLAALIVIAIILVIFVIRFLCSRRGQYHQLAT